MATKGFQFELTGVKAMMGLFDQLPTKSMQKNVMRKVLKKSLEPIRDEAIAKLGAHNLKSDKLGSTIRVTSSLKRSQKPTGKKDPTQIFMYVGSYAPHAHLVEFGTTGRHKKSGASTGFTSPKPFLRPAWDANKLKSLEIFKLALWQSIFKAAQTLAKKAERGTLTKGQIAGLNQR
jgi:HK97 gp10 family phage protein